MRARCFTTTAVSVIALLLVAVPAQAAVNDEAEALTVAISQAVGKGYSGSLEVSSPGAASFGRARAIFGAEGGGANPLEETAYTFMFYRAGGFVPSVPVPPKTHLNPAKYLAVIIAPDGGLEYLYAGPTAPPIAQLGTVVTLTLSSSQASTASRSCKVDELLATALRRKHLHSRLASAEHSLQTCKAHHR
jgi:hypothetical protein